MGSVGKSQPERYFRTPVTAPGPAGGDMLRSFGLIRRDPLQFLVKVRAEHGDVVQFPIPSPPTYLVTDPTAVDQVLRVNARAYGKRTLQYSSLSLVTGEGLLTADTEVWRSQRRVVQPAFHHEQVSSVVGHAAAAVERLDDQWSRLPDGAVVDIDAAMMHAALEVVGGTLFGTDLSGEAEQLAHATLAALEVVVGKARNPLSPPLWVPTPGNVSLRRSLAVLNSVVDRMVSERTATADRPHDMLDMLIDGFGLGNGVEQTEVRDQVVTFMVAGHETVASALTWAWHLLDSAPEVMQRVREEADSVLGDRMPTLADVAGLKLARAVLDETLRLYPPAWLITRKALEADVLAGCDVPAGALIVISPWLVHRHEGQWPEPERFDPDRFADPSASSPTRSGYIPFGTGPRMCIGRDFALLEGTVVLAMLARTWEFAGVERAGIVPEPLVTVRPQHGLPMRVRARNR